MSEDRTLNHGYPLPHPDAASARADVARIRQAIQEIDGDMVRRARTLDSHAGDKNNPHKVTAAQVGAFTRAETQKAVASAERKIDDAARKFGASLASHTRSTNATVSKISKSLAGRLSLSGGRLRGPLILSGPPANPAHPVTKRWFDAYASYT